MTYRTCCGREWSTGRAYASHTSHHARVWASVAEKFWDRVDRTGECWVWTAGKNSNGYGTIAGDGRAHQYAHRVSWQMEHGAIPEGMNVLHHCDNPPCVRPIHLFLGGQKLNGEDMAAKGRSTWGEKNAQVKLTDQQAADIAASTEPVRVLAERYGINESTVSKIRLGRRRSRSVSGCAARVHRQTKALLLASLEKAVEGLA